jgi:hypothetical protein
MSPLLNVAADNALLAAATVAADTKMIGVLLNFGAILNFGLEIKISDSKKTTFFSSSLI